MVEFKMHVVLLSLLNKLLLKMPLGTFRENAGALFGGKSLKSNDIIFKLLWEYPQTILWLKIGIIYSFELRCPAALKKAKHAAQNKRRFIKKIAENGDISRENGAAFSFH